MANRVRRLLRASNSAKDSVLTTAIGWFIIILKRWSPTRKSAPLPPPLCHIFTISGNPAQNAPILTLLLAQSLRQWSPRCQKGLNPREGTETLGMVVWVIRNGQSEGA